MMSTLGRDEGTPVLSWSSVSEFWSTEGGSESTEDASESAMVGSSFKWRRVRKRTCRRRHPAGDTDALRVGNALARATRC